MQQGTALLIQMETGWGRHLGAATELTTLRVAPPPLSFYPRRPLAVQQWVGELLSDTPGWVSPQGHGRPSGPGPGAGPSGSLAPQARCGQRTRYLKVARSEGQGGGSTETCPWLSGRCWGCRAGQDRAPTSHPLRSPCTACPESCLEPWNAAHVAGWVLGHLACPPPPRLGLGFSRGQKALRPTAGQVGCPRMVPPTHSG